MDHAIRNLIFFVDKSENTTHRFQKARGSTVRLSRTACMSGEYPIKDEEHVFELVYD